MPRRMRLVQVLLLLDASVWGAIRVTGAPDPPEGRAVTAVGGAPAAAAVTFDAVVNTTTDAFEVLHKERGGPVKLEVEEISFLRASVKGDTG